MLRSINILFLSPAQYFATIMVIVGLSVIATVIVLQFHHHDPYGDKMPKWVGRISPLLESLMLFPASVICHWHYLSQFTAFAPNDDNIISSLSRLCFVFLFKTCLLHVRDMPRCIRGPLWKLPSCHFHCKLNQHIFLRKKCRSCPKSFFLCSKKKKLFSFTPKKHLDKWIRQTCC